MNSQKTKTNMLFLLVLIVFCSLSAYSQSNVEDIAGVYSGQWTSTRYPESGYLVMTVKFNAGVAEVKGVFTGSKKNEDIFEATFTFIGANIWKMDFKGKKTKIKGTGLFKAKQFVGDYTLKSVFWVDKGRWVLDKE